LLSYSTSASFGITSKTSALTLGAARRLSALVVTAGQEPHDRARAGAVVGRAAETTAASSVSDIRSRPRMESSPRIIQSPATSDYDLIGATLSIVTSDKMPGFATGPRKARSYVRKRSGRLPWAAASAI